jgi:hemoglobin
MKTDIENRTAVELLVNSFYDRVNQNPVLSPIFNDVAKVQWADHLPVMYNFWASLLLGERGFSGNVMRKHLALSRVHTIGEAEFSEWIKLFCSTVDELFKEPKAEEAKTRAIGIAQLMLFKIGKV